MTRRTFTHANNPGLDCDHAVILIPFGRRSYLEAAVELYNGAEIPLDETTDRIAYHLTTSGWRVTLLYSGMGSPAAANAIEMATANGARRLVVFGACGGTDPRVRVGDLVTVTGAVRGEGTSRYYAPPQLPAVFDPELTVRLHAAATKTSREATHCGLVYTTDAGYRQGPEIYETYRGLTLAVESECAAAAVVGLRLGLQTGALLFCTDNITLAAEEDRAYHTLANPAVRRGFERGLAAVLAVLAEVPEPA